MRVRAGRASTWETSSPTTTPSHMQSKQGIPKAIPATAIEQHFHLLSNMTSEVDVGNDNGNLALDMVGSFGTCTTKSSTYCDESRSHKDSDAREVRKDIKSMINITKLKGGERGRFSISTTHGAEKDGGDDDSSIASADFENNDFDELVGEFFWYLRDRESSKGSSSKQGDLSITAPARTPRAMSGNGRVLTPRNSIKQGGDDGGIRHIDSSKHTGRNSISLVFDDVDGARGTEDQKENVTREASTQIETNKVDGSTALPTQAHRMDEAILTQTTIILDDVEVDSSTVRSSLSMEKGAIEAPEVDQVSIDQRSLNEDDPERTGIKFEAIPRQETPSPENKSKKESHEDDGTKEGNHMTPSRDDSWNAVFRSKGLMGRKPTPLKHMSSKVDENTESPKESNVRSKSEVLSDFEEFKQKKLTWPPPRNTESCPPLKSPSTTNKSGPTNTRETPPRDAESTSSAFDPDLELSMILDGPLVDSQTADLELSKILDDSSIDGASPGVNTIMKRTTEFLERQRGNLGENSSASMDQPSNFSSWLGSPPNDESETRETESERDDHSEKPESSSVVLTSRSIVADTSSVAFTSQSPPTNYANDKMTASSERRLDPAGFTIEYESNSLSPAESTTDGNQFLILTPTVGARTFSGESFSAEMKPSRSDEEDFEYATAAIKESGNAFTPVSKSPKDKGMENDLHLAWSNHGIEPKLSFDSLPLEYHQQAKSRSSTSPSESVSSRKTFGSFTALSLSAIEKKPGTPPNNLHSTMIMRTSIVFDSPALGGDAGMLSEAESTIGTTTPSSPAKSEESNLTKDSSDSVGRIASEGHSPPFTDSSLASTTSKAMPMVVDDSTSPPRFKASTSETVPSMTYAGLAEGSDESQPNLESVSTAVSTGSLSRSLSWADKECTANKAEQTEEVNDAGNSDSLNTLESGCNISMSSPNSNVSPIGPMPTSLCESESLLCGNSEGAKVTLVETAPPLDALFVQKLNQDTTGVSPTSSRSQTEPAYTDAEILRGEESVHAEPERTVELTTRTTETTPPLDPQFLHELNYCQDCAASVSRSSAGSDGSSQNKKDAAAPSPQSQFSSDGSRANLADSSTLSHVGRAVVMRTSPSPRTTPAKEKPSNNFNTLLSQWQEKSANNTNGHFLSPPKHDTAPRYAALARSQDPDRRKSTGQYKFSSKPKEEEESSLPKWTPPARSSARRRSIDISTISIPNKNVPSQKKSESSTTGHQKTVSYWNGMIQKSEEPKQEWAARSVIRRESTVPDNLMLTVPTQDPSDTPVKQPTLSTEIDVEDDLPCTCNESAFSGNNHLMEFFLPKLGMAHTCGRRNPPILIDSDPIGLHHILRPWQVEFLRSCDIYRGDQLVKACKKRAASLAGEMRKWRLERNMSCPKSVSCGMALHIWSRTCKYYVRTIRRQMADGMVEVEPPTLGEVMTTCKEQAETSFVSIGGDENDNTKGDYM